MNSLAACITRWILILIVLLSTTRFAWSAEKHALVIAIGNYPSSGGWPTISSVNDVPHVIASLELLGFNKDKIKVMLDEQCTKHKILKAFATLNEQIAEGDVVYIHFSGHGQQVIDDNGDELDQLDESIVPYDSPMEYVAGINEGQYLIRDDELNILTKEIRKRASKSGQVVLVLDSCHSGTGFRGINRSRGTDRVMAPDGFSSSVLKKSSTPFLDDASSDNLAPLIGIFGSSAKELNFETVDDQKKPVGSLSYSLSQIYANLKESISFEQLYNLVRIKMNQYAPRQNPQIEGDRRLAFLNSSTVHSHDFFAVKRILENQELLANCGTINRVYEGTKLQLVNTLSDQVITTGTVIKAKLNESLIRLEEEVTLSDKISLGMRIMQYGLPPVVLNINTESMQSDEGIAIYEKLQKLSFLTENVINADVYLEEHASGLILKDKYDLVLASSNKSAVDHETIHSFSQALKSAVQGKYLRSFSSTNPRINLELQLIEVDPDSEVEIAIHDPREATFKTGQCIKFKITNNGIVDTYVSMLDIQPDNQVNLVLPATELGYQAEEYLLKPGESMLTNFIVEIAEPHGQETLLLLGSRITQDLSGIIASKGNSRRAVGDMDPFEFMLQATYGKVQTRGTNFKSKKNKLMARSYDITITR